MNIKKDKDFLHLLITFIVSYAIIILLFLYGVNNEWKFVELAYLTPIILGFLYFRSFHPIFGESLKKQADTVSFFLGMLTSCGLIIKLYPDTINSSILEYIPTQLKIFISFFTLHFFCIFISVKFFISLLDYLHSKENKKSKTINLLFKILGSKP